MPCCASRNEDEEDVKANNDNTGQDAQPVERPQNLTLGKLHEERSAGVSGRMSLLELFGCMCKFVLKAVTGRVHL